MTGAHVVLGATGGLGHTLVEHLADTGRTVLAVVRNPGEAAATLPDGVSIAEADVTDPHGLQAALPTDAAAVHFAVGAPYHRWPTFLPAAVDAVVRALDGRDAVLVFPDNTYTFGPIVTDPVAEDHPRRPTPIVGMPRVAVLKRMLDAHAEGRIRVVVPRFGSFYGPHIRNRFAAGMFTNAAAGKSPRWLGALDVPHEMNFVRDVAATMVMLAEHEETWGQEWHVPGGAAPTGREFVAMIAEAAGTDLSPALMRHLQARIIGTVVPVVRGLAETIPQFQVPMRLDGRKLTAAVGPPPRTPHDVAVTQTYQWYAARS